MSLFKPADLRSKRRSIIFFAAICLVLLAYVDYFTGPSVSVTCFYLIPVFYLSWYGGRNLGLCVAFLHATVWLLIDLEWLQHPTAFIISWNFAVRFVTFAVVVWLVQLCKNLTVEVERLAHDRIDALQREVDTRATSENAIRQLANQLSDAEDSERRRLGLELHDSLGQSLTLLKLRLETLARQFPASEPNALEIQKSLEILSNTIRQARTLTFELYPSMLDQLGLAVTLRQYCQQLQNQVNAQIHVSDSGPHIAVPLPVTSFLFRVIKEVINNSLKHGAAREIVIQVRRSEGHLRVAVSDDGKGFDPQATYQSNGHAGLGLPWMRERVSSLGGSLVIESSPEQTSGGTGGGSRVIIDLPINPPLKSADHAAETKELTHGQTVTG